MQSSYNILFLTKWYPNKFDPQLGVFVKKHAKAASRKCNVALVFACQDNTLNKSFEIQTATSEGFTEVLVYYKKSNFLFNFFSYFIAIQKGIKEAQRSLKKIDMVHVNILTRPAVIALFMKRFNHTPYIITEHWTGYVSGKYTKSSALKKWITKIAVKNASAVTTVSPGLKEKMQEQGLVNDYFIIPNIIESILPPAPHNNLKVKILTVADLVDGQKNISGIIKAISVISKQNPAIEYHIIGDGPDKLALMALSDALQLTDKFIFFHGRQPNEYVYDYLKLIDFVVINSNIETFSVIAAEALANGKPVITTICGGPEYFITNDYGILIEKGNQQQLEEAIIKMLSDFRNYDPKTLNEYVSKKFNCEIVGDQFYEVYKSVIKERV